jgi:hypothetical protein
MSVVSKQIRKKLTDELNDRIAKLREILQGKELEETTVSVRYSHPENYVYIDLINLRLAISDFKSILTELGKIK